MKNKIIISMRAGMLLVAILFALSCNNNAGANQVPPPSDKDIQQAVVRSYEHLQEAAGGGGYRIDEVNVLRTRPGEDDTHFYAEVAVTGVHTSPPLAQRAPDEPIHETREVHLEWSKGEWTRLDE